MSAEKKWIAADWPAPDNVIAGATLRFGGVSTGAFESLNLGAHVSDDKDAVDENRRRFTSFCELPSEPLWLRQVHGTTVVVDPTAGLVPEADASITRRSGVVCAVLTADCLPVLFTSADGAELAAVHAGWRGLASGVLEATVEEMSTAPANILAWLGPAISQPAFEVGGEVREEFLAQDSTTDQHFVTNDRGRWQADLYGLARMRLTGLGIGHISGRQYCTFGESERFFSYRRDGACGRMASFVYRR